ncbi:hypothetical protein ACTG16_22995 [Aeromonas sp. 23P]|uniref:hypothetical protein n=1 Tax=Aeromonas sp. 23P TaxID=3452716 RepID=UPI003F7AFE62
MLNTLTHYYVVNNHTLCASGGHFAHAPYLLCSDNPNLGTMRVIATHGGSPLMGVVIFAVTEDDLIRLATLEDAFTFRVGEMIKDEIAEQARVSSLKIDHLIMLAATLRKRIELKHDQLKVLVGIDYSVGKVQAAKQKSSLVLYRMEEWHVLKAIDIAMQRLSGSDFLTHLDALATECKKIIPAIQSAPLFTDWPYIGSEFVERHMHLMGKVDHSPLADKVIKELLGIVSLAEETHLEFTQLGKMRIDIQARKDMLATLCRELKKLEYDLTVVGEGLADRKCLLMFAGVPKIDWEGAQRFTEETDILLAEINEAIELYSSEVDKIHALSMIHILKGG